MSSALLWEQYVELCVEECAGILQVNPYRTGIFMVNIDLVLCFV